jgi:hypothetical protein
MDNLALIVTSLLAATALAKPISDVEQRASSPSDLETRPPPTNSKLKTTMITEQYQQGEGQSQRGPYHVGAGLGEAVLVGNDTIGDVEHLNASNNALIFTIGNCR